jgi:hypothetical protein
MTSLSFSHGATLKNSHISMPSQNKEISMLTAILRKRRRSEDSHGRARHRRQLGFPELRSNSSDLREGVASVNTGNNYPYMCTDQVPENERTTKDAKANSPPGSAVDIGVGPDK